MVRRRKRGCSERLSFKVNKANKGRESDKERRVRRANENEEDDDTRGTLIRCRADNQAE